MSTMDPLELARWNRFAAKGGIGKCTAVNDCVAEGEGDLMFLTDDEITVLLQVPDQENVYLGYCEGVIGRFKGSDVRFHSKLKKPVMAKRQSSTSLSSHVRIGSPLGPGMGEAGRDGLTERGGTGASSRGSTPASPFLRTDSRSSLKNSPLASNTHLPTMTISPPPTSPPTRLRTISPPPSSPLPSIASVSGPPPTSLPPPPINAAGSHTSLPLNLSSQAPSTTSSATQPPNEILNLQHHFQLVEEGWRRDSILPPGSRGGSSRVSIDSAIVPGIQGADGGQVLELLDAQIDPLRVVKKSPTFPSAGLFSTNGVSAGGKEMEAEGEGRPTSPTLPATSSVSVSSSPNEPSPPPPITPQDPATPLTPLSPGVSTPITPDPLAQTLIVPPKNADSNPNTGVSGVSNYSQGSWGDRLSVASAEGVVGIGLSLLQNLADGEDSDYEDDSDSDSAYGDAERAGEAQRRTGTGLDSATRLGSEMSGMTSATTTNEDQGYSAAFGGNSAVGGGGGLMRQDSVRSEGTIDGLRYGSGSEDEDGSASEEDLEGLRTGTFPMPPTHVFPNSPAAAVGAGMQPNSILQQLSPTALNFNFGHPPRGSVFRQGSPLDEAVGSPTRGTFGGVGAESARSSFVTAQMSPSASYRQVSPTASAFSNMSPTAASFANLSPTAASFASQGQQPPLSPTDGAFGSVQPRPAPQRSQSYSSLVSQRSQGSASQLSPTAHLFPTTSPPTSYSNPRDRRPSNASANTHASVNQRERRPSNAPSLAPSLAASTASWEGDIYDDYRYSRYSMSSVGGSLGRAAGKRMSSMSVFSVSGSGSGGGVGEVPPVPERKEGGDGVGVGPSAGVASTGAAGGGSPSMERARTSSGTSLSSIKEPTTTRTRTRTSSGERLSLLSALHRKQDSDASVYTQASRVSVQSVGGMGGGVGGFRTRLEGVDEVETPLGSAFGSTSGGGGGMGSLRSSPSLQAGSLRSSPSLQPASLGSSPSLQASSLRSRSNSNSTEAPRSRANSTTYAQGVGQHRPPPLDLVGSNLASTKQPSESTTTSTSAEANTGNNNATGDVVSNGNNTSNPNNTHSASNSVTSNSNSAGSPLLHATWGSPLSSPSSISGSTAGLGGFSMGGMGSPTGTSFRGAASAMRQMLEEQSGGSGDVGKDSGGANETIDRSFDRSIGSMDVSMTESERKVVGLGKRIVVEDDEELPSHIRPDESYTTANDSSGTIFYEEPSMREKQEEEDEGQDLDVADIPVLPATPISAAAPPLPPSLSSSPIVTAASSTSTSDLAPSEHAPAPASHLRPSLRELREGATVRVPGTGERRSLFLPHPGAPKTPKDLGGEESAGPMYVRDRGGPVSPSTPGEGHESMVSPPLPNPFSPPGASQPFGFGAGQQQQQQTLQSGPLQAGYSYGQQGPTPPMFRPSAPQIIIQALSRPPPPVPPPGPPGTRRITPRGPTIYGRIEGDFTTSMGPIPITWSVDPPPTKFRIPPSGQGQGQMGIGGPMNVVAGNGAGGAGPMNQGPHAHPPGPITVPTHPPIHSSPLRSGSVPPPSTMSDLATTPGIGKRPSVISLREGMIPSSQSVVVEETAKDDSQVNPHTQRGSVGAPIPRANFFPKVGAVGSRPRSRSFSGVSATESGLKKNEVVPVAAVKKTNSLLGSPAASAAGKAAPHRPSPLSLPQNNVTTGPSTASPSPTTAKKGNPLLRPQISSPVLKPPSSPLARDVTFGSPAPPPPPSPKRQTSQDKGPLSPRKMSFGLGRTTSSSPSAPDTVPTGQVPSISRVTSPESFRSTTSPPPNGPTGIVPGVGLHLRRLTGSKSAANLRDRSNSNTSWEEAVGFRPPSTTSTSSRPIPARGSTLSPPPPLSNAGGSVSSSPTSSLHLDTAFVLKGGNPAISSPIATTPLNQDSDAASIRSGVQPLDRGQGVTSPSFGQPPSPTVHRSNSLKNKLSLPNLRRNKSRPDDDNNASEFMLQVNDTDFEFVRPSISHFGAARASEDSGVLAREPAPESAGGGGATTFLRAESPAFSISSSTRSPTTEVNGSWVNPPKSSLSLPPQYGSPSSPVTPDTATIEAHRNREQKWMSLLGSSPPAQARKSKKVRKLLLDGVPASVRYLVWSHLTDGKAKCVPGVYPQLCKRGPVPLSDRIEADVETSAWFLDEERSQLQTLREAGGGIVQLLEAYLNMVPDIQYSPGLPHIVGQLLLIAPEEDAFWIFVSIMDSHIRPYFASGSAQMDVDASLFKTALEVNDGPVAKKLFVDMGILPVSICQPWFSSLFVGCLPDDYLLRTWDMFLYEGIPFLIRTGLSIVSFVRRQLLECTSEEAVLTILHRPPLIRLPPTTENYISFALNVKLKDDDIRKQRIKLEAQVKRQTQQQQPRSAGSISLPRT